MKAPLVTALLLLAGSAAAQDTGDADPAFTRFDAQIRALGQRVDADASGGIVRPEIVQELRGKQQELANREATLKTEEGPLTPDEKMSMARSISDQEKRVARATQHSLPQMRRPDPSSLPPPTYVTPNGMTISGPNPGISPTGVQPITPPANPAAPVATPVPVQ